MMNANEWKKRNGQTSDRGKKPRRERKTYRYHLQAAQNAGKYRKIEKQRRKKGVKTANARRLR